MAEVIDKDDFRDGVGVGVALPPPLLLLLLLEELLLLVPLLPLHGEAVPLVHVWFPEQAVSDPHAPDEHCRYAVPVVQK